MQINYENVNKTLQVFNLKNKSCEVENYKIQLT